MAQHMGMYNTAREEGRQEVMAGLQQQNAVNQMVASAEAQAGEQGFQAGRQNGADETMKAVMAGLNQGEQQQPQFSKEDVIQVAQGLESGEITQEIAAQIEQQSPGLLDSAIAMIEQSKQQASQGVQPQTQAGLSSQSV